METPCRAAAEFANWTMLRRWARREQKRNVWVQDLFPEDSPTSTTIYYNYEYIYIYTCVYIDIYIYIWCIFIYIYILYNIYIYTCVCVHLCIYMYMYMYMFDIWRLPMFLGQISNAWYKPTLLSRGETLGIHTCFESTATGGHAQAILGLRRWAQCVPVLGWSQTTQFQVETWNDTTK